MYTLDSHELEFARKCLRTALEKGATKARVTASKSTMDLFGTLNGETDKVTHCLDRAISINLFVNGRYGVFSTNRFDEGSLDAFIAKAISTTGMLAEDKFRNLPSPERTSSEAVSGYEMDVYDKEYENMTPQIRQTLALEASVFGKRNGEKWTLLSEEAEYSDAIYDTFVIDSNGLECRHIETSFEYGVEMTIEDKKGNRYSGYWWDSSPFLRNLDINSCCPIALDRAIEQMNPKRHRGGKCNMVLDSEVASKAVSPILNALNGYSLQQNNSFLRDSLGKQLFPEGLTILDCPHRKGESGSRLFDSEGVATIESPIIEKGVVKQYFINTYMSGKMGVAPTVEDPFRPVLHPFPKKGLGRKEILEMCGDGILVTGFNGGNSNSATGDFSYGIEGFAFKDGKITHPVHEMVVTGNFLTLWQGFIAAGSDSRLCKSKLIPTLAFSNVDFSS